MKIVKAILPLVLAGSVALAGTAPKQSAPKSTSQHKAAPLATPASSTTPAATMAPATDKAASTDKATEAKAADAKATMTTKISKEQAGTIALGTMKGAEIVSSELKEHGGKQVWAVTLKEGDKKHQVMVDAKDGAIMKNDTKHTKHHAEGAAPEKH